MTDHLRIRIARRRPAAMACALMLAVAGCGGPLPAITAGPDAADPRAGSPSARYTPVTAGTVDHQPVEPKAWRDMNDRVAPRPRYSP